MCIDVAHIIVMRQGRRRRVSGSRGGRLGFSFESLIEDGAFETHALDVALDSERLEVELVVFDFDLAHLFLELLVL